MKKSQLAQFCGIAGALLAVAGAVLYAINYPNRPLTMSALGAGFVLAALFAVLNAGLIKSFFGKRSSKYGANMLAMIILFICILTVIQTLSVRHSIRFDLTRNARFSLASQTVSLLESLSENVSIIAFYKKSAPERAQAQNLLDQYAHASPRIRYEFIDPDRRPQYARDIGVTNYGTTVVQAGDTKELITDLNEEKLTNAVLKSTRDVTKAVYFVQGHGEKDPLDKEAVGYSFAKEAIEKEGYRVGTLSLFEEEAVPDDAHIIIVAGPANDLFASELQKIEAYLAKGRNAIIMLEPFVALPAIEQFIASFGLAVDADIVIDPFSRIFGGEYTIPVVTQYVEHPITKGFNVATFFPVARSVRMLGDAGDSEVQYLAQTGKSAWGEKDLEAYRSGTAARDETDIQAPVPLAAISAKKGSSGTEQGETGIPGSKLVLFGDSDFAANASFRVSGNADLIMNTIHFLAEEKDLIAIRPKQSLGDQIFLTASQGRLVFLLCVIILPLSIITFGSTLFVRRKRRG